MLKKFFAGIGSRETPLEICELMHDIAYKFATLGWILRSGGADGADSAFQYGVEQFCNERSLLYKERQEIYLPWIGFNDFNMDWDKGYFWIDPAQNPEIDKLARHYHPKYENLGRGARKLIGRNGHQILGKNLDLPVQAIIAWTPDASIGKTTADTGGTGHALRIAYGYKLPIWNLERLSHRLMIKSWLQNEIDIWE